jgi:hypothetical protein
MTLAQLVALVDEATAAARRARNGRSVPPPGGDEVPASLADLQQWIASAGGVTDA